MDCWNAGLIVDGAEKPVKFTIVLGKFNVGSGAILVVVGVGD
jgi:hypothetical protein